MEVNEFSNKQSQVAGSVVRDKKGELWKVLEDIPYVGFKLNQPFESEFYEKIAPVDYEKLIIAQNESISELKRLISALESRVKILEPEPEYKMNANDFYFETDLAGITTLRIRR